MWTETRDLKLSRDSLTISNCNDRIYQARIMMGMDQRGRRGEKIGSRGALVIK